MKKLFLFLTVLLFVNIGHGQTTLIDSIGNGGFESGITFPANGWTVVNGTKNQYYIGSTPGSHSGTNTAFSGSSSTTWAGTANSSTNHFYRDITFPAAETKITLKFYYKLSVVEPTFDFLKVFLIPTTTTPSAGTALTSGQIGLSTGYDIATTWTLVSITIPPSVAGTTKRLVFSWKVNIYTPFSAVAIDDISLISMLPVPGNAAPVAFNPTSISQTAMNIGWTDNSTNETAFRVYRSSDNISFTKVGSDIVSTTTEGTGSNYSQMQTGLLPGTTYYYKIAAVADTESNYLTASQATNPLVPMTGSWTINPLGSGGTNFTTFAAAINYLNLNGVGLGGVTFNVVSDFTETAPIGGFVITASGTISDSVIIQKNGTGANPLITAPLLTISTNYDGVIKIAGGDYITIDGIDITENTGNTTYKTDWGYALVKGSASAPFNGCQNVTLKNCNISLNKSNSTATGIYTGNHIATSNTALTITSTNDAMNNCKFFNNTISNVYCGISISGYSAFSPYILYDSNNEIGVDGANTITNLGGSNSPIRGIYANYQKGLKIANNSIISSLNGLTSDAYGILTAIGNSSNIDIYNNIITFTHTAGLFTNTVYGINNEMGNNAASNTININNNSIINCNISSATSAKFYGIMNEAGASNINLFENTIDGNIINNTSTEYTPSFIGIYTIGNNPVLHSNTISNNKRSGSGNGNMNCIEVLGSNVSLYLNNIYNDTVLGGNGSICGYYNGSGSNNETYYDNTIFNLIQNGTGSVIGFYLNTSGGIKNIYRNTFHNLNGGGDIYGLFSLYGSPANIYNNNFYNINTNGTTTQAMGIRFSGNTGNIYNNFISDIKASSSTNPTAVIGIYLGGTIQNIYYNTIYLNALSSSVTTFGSAGIYKLSNTIGNFRNNIIVNNSTAGPAAESFTVAFKLSGAYNASYYALTSNNNCFYTANPSANNLIFYDGISGDQSIEGFKTRVGSRDAASISEMPPFNQIITAPYNLHLLTSTPSGCESGGEKITSPSISYDFDFNIRYGEAGYTGSGSSTDIGADEFEGAPSCTTPNPGNTIASTNAICIGNSVMLSLQNTSSGTGYSYQWQSSLDGTSYFDIPEATTPTFTTTPFEITFFKCNVSCQNGPVTIASFPVQITFATNITSTTAASRCGVGTVNLTATASGNGIIAWHSSPEGGVILGSGTSFTTPVITTTTEYYVGEELYTPNSITIGSESGTNTSSTYPAAYGSFWGNSRAQYLVLASELSSAGFSAGNITSLAFDVTALGNPATLSGYTIKIGSTAASSITTWQTLFAPITVYGPVNYTAVIGSYSANRHVFTSPYYWDGSSNIIIDLCFNNGLNGVSNALTKLSASGFSSSVYYGSDGIVIDGVCATTAISNSSYSRPNMMFGGNTSCSGPRVQVIATVTPPPELTINTEQTICNNAVTTLNVTSPLSNFDTYVWTPSVNLYTNAAATIAYVAGTSATTVYFKSATTATFTYVCSASNSSLCSNTDTSSIIVLPANPGIIAIASPLCSSGTSKLNVIPSSGYGNAAFQWKISTDNIIFTEITGHTSLNEITDIIDSTTYYQLIIKDGTGNTCAQPTVTVVVNDPVYILTTSPATRCGAGTVNIGATATAGAGLQWYAAENAVTSIGTGASFNTAFIYNTTNYYVAAEVVATSGTATIGDGTQSSSSYDTPFNGGYGGIKTQYLFTASELNDANIYAGKISGLSIEVTAIGTSYNGFYIQIGNTSLNDFYSPDIQGGLTTMYNASVITPNIGSNTYTFSTPFVWDGVSNIFVSISWSNANTFNSGCTVKTDPTSNYSSQSYSADTQSPAFFLAYTGSNGAYASQNRPQFKFNFTRICSSSRTPVTATLTPAPELAITSDQTVCNNAITAINITSTLSDYNSYKWTPVNNLYIDAAASIPYSAGSSASTVYFKTTTAGTFSYICSAENAVLCANTDTTTITVLPSDPTITAISSPLCMSGISELRLSPNSGYGNAGFQWKSSSDNINFIDLTGHTSINDTTMLIDSTTYYQLIIKDEIGNTCLQPKVAVIVRHPQVLTTNSATRCGTGSVDLTATAGGTGNLTWYSSSTGGSYLGLGSPFTTPVITATSNFYVSEESPSSANITLGTGTSRNNYSGYPTAFGNYWFQDWSQMVFTAGELQAAGLRTGNITALTFNIYEAADPATVANYALRIGTTTAATLSDFTTSGLTCVYGPSAITSSVGLNTISFSTPFYWDGVSNLIIDIRGDGAYGSANARTYYTTTANNTVVYGYTFDNNPGFYNSYPIATPSKSRLNIIFSGIGSCSSPRVQVVATVTPPPVLNITADQTICNNAITTMSVISNLADYESYIWTPATGLFTDASATIPYLAGASATTVYVKTTNPGTFTYICSSANPLCLNADTSIITVIPPNPLITAISSPICVSGSTELKVTPSSGYGSASFQWKISADNFVFTDITGHTSLNEITDIINTITYYKLQIKDGSGNICSQPTVSVDVKNPQLLTTIPGSRCGLGTVNLGATAATGCTLKWFDASVGGNEIGTGSFFTTPNITSTTNFYVAAMIGDTTIIGGRLSPSTNLTSTANSNGLIFDTYKNFILKSVDVYAITEGNIYIELRNNTGTVIQSVTKAVIAGSTTSAQTLILDFNVPIGSGLQLIASTSSSLVRESSLGGFPYSLGENGAITSGYNDGEVDTYYYFYNWVMKNGCIGARTAVTATVTIPPTLSITADQGVCNNSIAMMSVTSPIANYGTYIWTPINNLYTDASATIPYINGTSATIVYVKSPIAGMTTYSCFASNTSLCSNIASSNLTVYPVPNITVIASSNPICTGTSTSLSANFNYSGTTPSYLAPPQVIYPNYNEDIGNISFGTLNNTTDLNSLTGNIGIANGTAGSFSDFTAFGPYNFTAGNTYSLSVSTIAQYSEPNAIGVYIDYNRNGVFTDAGEAVYLSTNTTNGAHTETANILIPPDAASGITRLRVIVNEWDLVINPTTTVYAGEFEEYSLNIIAGEGASFSWSDGSTIIGTSNPINVSPVNSTSYILTVTEANLCTITLAPYSLNVSPVVLSLIPVNVSCYGGSDGSFSIDSVYCGTPPFTFSINGGSFGNIPTNLTSGIYMIRAKDANLILSSVMSITISQPNPIEIPTADAPFLICQGTTSAFMNATTGIITVLFDVTAQPNEVYASPGTIASTALLPPLPEGSTITNVSFNYSGLTANGNSSQSDIKLGFSGAVIDAAYSGIDASSNSGSFNYTRQISIDAVNHSGGIVNLLYQENSNDETDADATFPLGNAVASLTITYTPEATINWYDASTGGNYLGQGSIEAIGTTTLPNSNTPGNYHFYAEGRIGNCRSLSRADFTIIIVPPSSGGVVTAALNTISGGQNAELLLTGNTGNIIKWQKSSNNGINWTDIYSILNPYSEIPDSAATWLYRAVVQNADCAEANSSTATIVVNLNTTTFTSTIDNDWNNPGNWDHGVPTNLFNAIIPSDKLAVVNSNNNECNNLTLAPRAMLTMNASKSLVVNGTLIMLSDNSGTASLINNGSLTTNGNNVERYIPKPDAFHMLASPVSAQSISPDFNETDGFYLWNEAIDSWIEYADAANFLLINGGSNFNIGKGYAVSYPGIRTKNFVGILNNGNIDIPLTFTPGATYSGWNFVANPYPSSINWSSISGWTRNTLADAGSGGKAMWIWNPEIGNYGSYISNTGIDTGTNSVTRNIAMSQGFWVKTLSGGILGMTNETRVHSSQTFLKSAKASSELIRLTVKGSNAFSDEIIIKFGNADDNGGAEKMFSMYENAPGLYSNKANKKWSINNLTSIANHPIITVGFKSGVNETYTIKSSGINSFSVPTYVYLKDMLTNSITYLNQYSVYSFTAGINDNANRFQLMFTSTPLEVTNNNIANISIYANGNSIYILSNESIQQITIYNTLGQILKCYNNITGNYIVNMGDYTPAYYFVRVISSKKVYLEKIFIHR